jgi:hypothetical protein
VSPPIIASCYTGGMDPIEIVLFAAAVLCVLIVYIRSAPRR